MPIIELINISKRFAIKRGRLDTLLHPFTRSYKEVLNNLNLVIENQGIYSLIGPNGTGKTTLLRILSGILYPDNGFVKIDGEPFVLNPYKVFLISESEKGFFPRLTLKNNLKFFASLILSDKEIINKKIEKIIHDFDLDKETDTRFQELSTGIKQRLAIARAMLFDPEIILFDEITKGIDIKQQQLIYSLIRRFKEQGKTIIFATHLINEIKELSDKIILINDGRIISFGNYDEIKGDLKRVFGI